jgi:hypothetical protein
MDIISHGLWGSVAFGRKTKRAFWLAFFIGIAPDFFSFGIFFLERLLTGNLALDHRGPPDLASIPSYIDTLYNLTHSLVVFAIVFIVVWLWQKKPCYPMAAWGLHILIDIPTHGVEFFPTPFLWPLSEYRFDGVSWGHPAIFFSNIALLIIAYAWFIVSRLRARRQEQNTL